MSQQSSNQPPAPPLVVDGSKPNYTKTKDITLGKTLQWSRHNPQLNCADTCPICLFGCSSRFDSPFHQQEQRRPRTIDCLTHHAVKINQCGHIFGFNCLHKWLFNPGPQSGTCPLCRVQVVPSTRNTWNTRGNAQYAGIGWGSSQAHQNIRRGIDVISPWAFHIHDPVSLPPIYNGPVSLYREFQDGTYRYEYAHYSPNEGGHIYRRRLILTPIPPRAWLMSPPGSSPMGPDISVSPTGLGPDYFALRRHFGPPQASQVRHFRTPQNMDQEAGPNDETTEANARWARARARAWREELQARSSGNNQQRRQPGDERFV